MKKIHDVLSQEEVDKVIEVLNKISNLTISEQMDIIHRWINNEKLNEDLTLLLKDIDFNTAKNKITDISFNKTLNEDPTISTKAPILIENLNDANGKSIEQMFLEFEEALKNPKI